MDSLRNLANHLDGAPSKPRRLRVLLADGNSVSRVIAIRLFEKRGHEITTVENAAQAVEISVHRRFDLALLDASEDATALREAALRQGFRVPIWGMAVDAENGECGVGLAEHFDRILPKPLDAATLSLELHRLLAGD
jgi:two-component system CheB/CheR fusion protein